MNRRALLAVAVALFAVLAAGLIGTVAYRAGVEQGVMEAGRFAAAPPAAGAPAYPYGYYGYHGHPHWVFAPFGFFLPLLFFFACTLPLLINREHLDLKLVGRFKMIS